ncbi:MAG: AraC family transcriptional regulator [Anaerovoracaceae bacterium]
MKNFVIPSIDRPDPNNQAGLSNYLTQSLEAFSDITGIPITFFNSDNEILMQCNTNNKICNMFQVYSQPDSACRKNLTSAGQFSSRLGEPYIFLCKSGLTNIAMPLIIDRKFIGYFIAGPIVMGELRGSTVKKFSSLNSLNDVTLKMAEMFANKMHAYLPNQVSELALLLHNCIITSVSRNNDYSLLRNQNEKQNQINVDIQNIKKEHVDIEYPYALENETIENIVNGNSEKAQELFEHLLNTFSIMETGSMDGVRTKVIWFFAIVIRTVNESGTNIKESVDLDLDIINRICDAETYGQLLAISLNLVDLISKNTLRSVYSGNSQIISKALQFINNNFKDKISLKDIESNLHVNPSYFSTLFKSEMGVTFTDYINSLKVEYACSLLTNSNMSIIDISLSAGFDDQSYFTKVFRKIKGVTPKQYRTNHNRDAADLL